MKLQSLAALALLLPVLSCSPSPVSTVDAAQAEASSAEPVRVYLLRHAEKQKDGTDDPGLTELGVRRSEKLASLLQRQEVSHLFCTRWRRTRDTLSPLVEARGLEPVVVEAGDSAELASQLRALEPGAVAVVAGHSNTIPAVVAELGVQLPGLVENPRYGSMFPEAEYGRVVELVWPGGRTESTPDVWELQVDP